MLKKITIILLSSLISQQTNAKTNQNTSQLLLVGGGLKSCSSMSKKNCNNSALTTLSALKNIKHNNLYQVSLKTLNLLKKLWPKDFDSSTKAELVTLISRAVSSNNQENISLKELKFLLRKHDKNNLIAKLNDPEYYALLDILEQPVINKTTNVRLKEQVELLDSTNFFSTNIYQTFVKNARINTQKDKPNIVVLTASARDPFEAADFYQAAFTQAGANAKWLPLDATLNHLMQIDGSRDNVCQKLTETRLKVQGSMNRELIYPDLTEQQMQACLSPQTLINDIKNADGLFINGGDQSLTLKAFIKNDGTDSEILTIIKEKLKNGNYIVGGTSAGTAVMSGGLFSKNNVPMITNGQSNTAMIRGAKKDQLPVEGCQKSNQCDADLLNDDLTYRSMGGLGLFKWGILDTHFSERGRQGRLAQLTLDTHSAFAFGVDEATALVVSNLQGAEPSFKVIGQGGVFIIENSALQNSHGENQTIKADMNKTANSEVITHYINYGDTAHITNNTLQINLAEWKNLPVEQLTSLNTTNALFKGSNYKLATEIMCRSNIEKIAATDSWKNHNINMAIAKMPSAKSRYSAIKLNNNPVSYCSYKNYKFAFNTNK